MVPEVRSSKTEVVFDLVTQAGVMQALAYVRASQASTGEKRELRDLIFSYTNNGGDPALRGLIEARLEALPGDGIRLEDLAVSKDRQENPPPPRSGFASSRPVPDFAPIAVSDSVVAKVPVSANSNSAPNSPLPETGVPLPKPIIPKIVPNLDRSPTTARPIAMPIPTAVVPTEITQADYVPLAPEPMSNPPAVPKLEATTMPEPIVPKTVLPPPFPDPIPDPIPVPAVPKSEVDKTLSAVAPVPQPSVEYQPPYREDSSLDGYRQRITEIKQMINAKVGNPVNLIGTNNEIGSAYMTALLAAMKSVSGGGGDVESAMANLEAAVKAVEELLNIDTNATVEAVNPTVSVDESLVSATEVPIPVPPTSMTRLVVADNPVNQPIASANIRADIDQPLNTPATGFADPKVSYDSELPIPTPEKVIPITHEAVAASRFKNVQPVAAAEPLKTPADLPSAADLKEQSGVTDPLFGAEIDQGLDQLLGEWGLFKKSGVFGTGPRGSKHPLFIKLAAVPMPLILSGRFDGATNEIRQSITDYMNGWRYEQGIIYQPEESFEHYLRRVIRHIIDSQTKLRRA